MKLLRCLGGNLADDFRRFPAFIAVKLEAIIANFPTPCLHSQPPVLAAG